MALNPLKGVDLFIEVYPLYTPPIPMKHLILLIFLCLPFTKVNAGWFSKGPDPLIEAKEKITALENKLTAQSIILNRWQITSGSLALGCVILLILGAALGSKTRHHYDSTRRLGRTPSTPPPSTLNGRKPSILGEEAEENLHSTLAA